MFNQVLKWLQREKKASIKPSANVDIPVTVKPQIKNTSSRYRRTSGYHNWMNRRRIVPRIAEGIAQLSDGTTYRVWPDGWRRMSA